MAGWVPVVTRVLAAWGGVCLGVLGGAVRPSGGRAADNSAIKAVDSDGDVSRQFRL